MECGVDAQSLISMSLLKIQTSRSQRGGMKLHKNLLVSRVLRDARQVYLRQRYAEVYLLQQHEEVLTVCSEIQELDPLELDPEEEEEEEEVLEPPDYRSCCMQAPVSRCSRTTVLDLDTHVVTTVESGFLHQDCCCAAPQCAPVLDPDSPDPAARKRKGDFRSPEEEVSDFTEPRKRLRRDQDHTDTSNISALISIFGSGFSGLLSRQADLEQICGKQALASLGAWTRAIVAF